LLGFNPGGNRDTIKQPFEKEMAAWKNRTENAYLDEQWEKGDYQSNVRALCEAVGVCPRTVCSSNWCFVRSKSADEIKERYKPEIFFHAHMAVMEIVRPDIVFAVGLETYKIVKKFFHFEENDSFPSGHGSWKCYLARRQYKQKEQKLIGFPHFSRYALRCHQDALDRVQRECL
jgi:hypothetical protein